MQLRQVQATTGGGLTEKCYILTQSGMPSMRGNGQACHRHWTVFGGKWYSASPPCSSARRHLHATEIETLNRSRVGLFVFPKDRPCEVIAHATDGTMPYAHCVGTETDSRRARIRRWKDGHAQLAHEAASDCRSSDRSSSFNSASSACDGRCAYGSGQTQMQRGGGTRTRMRAEVRAATLLRGAVREWVRLRVRGKLVKPRRSVRASERAHAKEHAHDCAAGRARRRTSAQAFARGHARGQELECTSARERAPQNDRERESAVSKHRLLRMVRCERKSGCPLFVKAIPLLHPMLAVMK
eukprot:5359768-Pleurochrysis_carterae.AAC.2